MGDINKFCDAMRWAADDNYVGYSQTDRWSLQPEDIGVPGSYNADCSSLVITCLRYAGFDTGSASYTANLSDNLTARGWVRLPNDNDPQVGDILLNDVNHVAVWLGDCLAQASHDEHGRYAGGEPGDQTGEEIQCRSYYNYPWDCYLRYTGSPAPKKRRKKMVCIIQPNGESRLVFFNGDRIIPITHPDQAQAIADVYKKCTGEDIPMFKFGSKKAPWATRLFEVFGG